MHRSLPTFSRHPRPQRLFAVDREVERPGDWDDETLVFELGIPAGPGYAWVFPKRNGLAVGLGSYGQKPPWEEFETFVQSQGLTEVPVIWQQGHTIPYWAEEAPQPLGAGPLLLVGDAAALANPLTGEGIYGASYSGYAAGRAVALAVTGETSAPGSLYARTLRPVLIENRRSLWLANVLRRTGTSFTGAAQLFSGLVRRLVGRYCSAPIHLDGP